MAEAGKGAVATDLPPVTELAATALALIVVGAIYLSAHIPGPVNLAPAIGLLVGAAVLLGVAALALLRIRRFAWQRFFGVGRWALAAYVIIAAMLEYVFVLDRVPGSELLLLSLMLLTFAITVPLIIAFTVARFQTVD